MPTLKPSKKGLEYFAQEEKKEENEPYASTNQNLAIIQKKYSELDKIKQQRENEIRREQFEKSRLPKVSALEVQSQPNLPQVNENKGFLNRTWGKIKNCCNRVKNNFFRHPGRFCLGGFLAVTVALPILSVLFVVSVGAKIFNKVKEGYFAVATLGILILAKASVLLTTAATAIASISVIGKVAASLVMLASLGSNPVGWIILLVIGSIFLTLALYRISHAIYRKAHFVHSFYKGKNSKEIFRPFPYFRDNYDHMNELLYSSLANSPRIFRFEEGSEYISNGDRCIKLENLDQFIQAIKMYEGSKLVSYNVAILIFSIEQKNEVLKQKYTPLEWLYAKIFGNIRRFFNKKFITNSTSECIGYHGIGERLSNLREFPVC